MGSTPTTYRPGAYIVVQFGGQKGRQLAKVARVLDGGYKVWKWRAQSKRWTKLVTVVAAEVLGLAQDHGSDLLRSARIRDGVAR